MQKILKIICFNIIFLLLLLGIAEAYSYKMYNDKYSSLMKTQSEAFANNDKDFYKVKYNLVKPFNYKYFTNELDNDVYTTANKKRGIITIGCSYTRGVGLEKNQTFAAKLNKYTGRTTYNRGVSGTGTQMVYRQLADKNFQREIPDAEYVIYTFIWDHLYRMFRPLYSPYSGEMVICYKLENNSLREIKYPFYPLYSLFTFRNFIDNKSCLEAKKEFSTGCPLFLKTVEESQKMMKKLYPDSKFVLLEFSEGPMCREDYIEGSEELQEAEIKKLEDMGIIYINAEKLVGHKLRDLDKYRVADKDHPSERAWDEVVPKLVQELNL